MKNFFLALAAPVLACGVSYGSIIQTVAGPDTASGGVDNVLINTTNDTGDWLDDLNTNGGTVYFGFDWTINNNAGETGGGGFFGGLGIFDTGSAERLLAGNGWTSLEYGAGAGGTINDTGQAYVVGDTVRIVLELSMTAGGSNDDSWRMWVDPTVADFATSDTGADPWDIPSIGTISNRAGNGTGSATMSNLVVATTFAEAVPEASEALIVLLGMTGLLGYRGRRR